MYTHEGRLDPTLPFDWHKLLAFVGEFAPTAHEQITATATLTKAIMIDGGPIVFSVRSIDPIDAPQLVYKLHAAQPQAVARKAKDALIARCGAAVAVDGTIYAAFPDPDQLAHMPVAEVGALVV